MIGDLPSKHKKYQFTKDKKIIIFIIFMNLRNLDNYLNDFVINNLNSNKLKKIKRL